MPLFLDEKGLTMWLDSDNYTLEQCEEYTTKLKIYNEIAPYEMNKFTPDREDD